MSQSSQTPHGLASRTTATYVLGRILDAGQALDLAFADAIKGNQQGLADMRDRAFVRRLVTHTLRRLGQVDAAIKRYLKKPIAKKDVRTRHILRIAVCEILFLDTPPHAAVDTAVSQANAHVKTRHTKGMINAVLRRITEDSETLLKDLSDVSNTPRWLIESWGTAYGDETAKAIADMHLTEPPLDLILKADADSAAWARILEADILPTGALRRQAGGSITELAGFDDGQWWVQDAAAALPASLMGDIEGQCVLDLCAAPGGKTLQLADQGAIVTALDRSKNRLTRVQENLERTGLAADLIAADSVEWRPEQPAPFVLLDAPCSATGTLRRHPDVARLKGPKDIGALIKAQTRLLDAAAEMTAPDGTLIYCTCSLQPEEGPDQITAFLKRHPAWQRKAIVPEEIGGLMDCITQDGELRTLPCHFGDRGGMDGFFAARLMNTS